MTKKSLSIPEVAIIAGTRAALGAGVALLLAERLRPGQRRMVGWTLVAMGAATTPPILAFLLGMSHRPGAARDAAEESPYSEPPS